MKSDFLGPWRSPFFVALKKGPLLVLRWNSLTFLLNQFAYPFTFTIHFYTSIKDGDGKLDYEETLLHCSRFIKYQSSIKSNISRIHLEDFRKKCTVSKMQLNQRKRLIWYFSELICLNHLNANLTEENAVKVTTKSYLTLIHIWDHPFKMSACLRGGRGVPMCW